MTTEQYQIGYEAGHSDGFDEAVKQAAQPDCRTCLLKLGKHGWDNEDCVRRIQGDPCTNGDKYEAAPRVVLWRTE